MEDTRSLNVREREERDYIGDPDAPDRRDRILRVPDRAQDEFDKIQAAAEELIHADRVGGVGGVGG
eukprot:2277543-Rhodomonas_salina.1